MQIALLSLQYMGRFIQSQTLTIVKKSAKNENSLLQSLFEYLYNSIK